MAAGDSRRHFSERSAFFSVEMAGLQDFERVSSSLCLPYRYSLLQLGIGAPVVFCAGTSGSSSGGATLVSLCIRAGRSALLRAPGAHGSLPPRSEEPSPSR